MGRGGGVLPALAKISGFRGFRGCCRHLFTDARVFTLHRTLRGALHNGARARALPTFAHFANNADVEHCFCDEMIRCKCIMHDMMMLASTWLYYPNRPGEVLLRNMADLTDLPRDR